MFHTQRLLTGHCVLSIILWVALSELDRTAAFAQPSYSDAYPSAASFERATEIFHEQLVASRQRTRSQLRSLADQFEKALSTSNPNSLSNGPKIVTFLRSSSETETARIHILSLKQNLPSALKTKADEVLEQLDQLNKDQANVKMAYRPFLAAHIQRRWDSASLWQLRELLFQYYALTNERPDWLQPIQPPLPSLPLTRFSRQALEEFEKQNQTLVRPLETEFSQFTKQTIAVIDQAVNAPSITLEQRAALTDLQSRLNADWAREFRSFMLWEFDSALPQSVDSLMRAQHLKFQGDLQRLISRAAEYRKQLLKRLSDVRDPLLSRAEFAEPFSIDWRLHELATVIPPIRIKAIRRPDIQTPEEAHLVSIDGNKYRVRWILDATESVLPFGQVILHKSKDVSPTWSSHWLTRPATANGIPVTDQTQLQRDQRLLLYRNGEWHEVRVVDLSPLGVMLHWDGHGEMRELELRENLFIPNTTR